MSRYSPFAKSIHDLATDDLAVLRDVAEGWYVEYKRQSIPPKLIAKSLSAFANQYGGWFFVGIQEAADGSRVAGSFPGVPLSEVPEIERAIREAVKDGMHPSIVYDHVVLHGPAADIGLSADRAVIVVEVPVGADTPYIHSDGRVYRRLSDSSAPTAEHDKHVLDALWRRGESRRERLKGLATRLPKVSQSESESPFLHIFISSDPLEQAGRDFVPDWDSARAVAKRGPVPLDNVFPRTGGFIARQAKGREHHDRLVTWEFCREGHSFFTIPIRWSALKLRPAGLAAWLDDYDHAAAFISELSAANVSWGRVLDLNLLLCGVGGIILKHRELMQLEGISGPFYAKAQLHDVWRTIPFLDVPAFVTQLAQDGVPLVQDSTILCPPGDGLDSFRVIPAANVSPDTQVEQLVHDGLTLALDLLSALGVSGSALMDGADEDSTAFIRASIARLVKTGP